jgi:membrane protein implicated in regulation of membrane protease activity
MGFKIGEIVAIVIALAIPIVGFAVLLWPGAMAAIYGFLLKPDVMPIAFFGGAAVLFGILVWRVYRRIRSKPGDPKT